MAYDFVINDRQGRVILDGSRFAVRIIHRAVVSNPQGTPQNVVYTVPGNLGSNYMIWVQEDRNLGIPAYRLNGNTVTVTLTGGQSATVLAVSFG